jgi:electron transfer flavoprotein alpha subunit
MATIRFCQGRLLGAEEERQVDVSDYRGVLIFGEQQNGQIAPVVYELLGKGRELADKLDEDLAVAVLGQNIEAQAEELVHYGADNVYMYDDPILANPRDDPYSQILTDLVKEVRPSVFLVGATPVGRSLAPTIANKLRTGLTADCTGLEVDSDGNLVQTRPAYGGNIMATIVCLRNRPQMATVRYKVMTKAEKNQSRRGTVIVKKVKDKLLDRSKIKKISGESKEISIAEAQVIVAGGKGLGNPEGFRLLKEFADSLGGVIGASRAVVDEGWIPYKYQVGLSGKTVRPKLYFACGISGTVQHLAGMQTADVIVAINKDPEAPIFSVADYGIVGDLYEIIPKITKLLRNRTLKR